VVAVTFSASVAWLRGLLGAVLGGLLLAGVDLLPGTTSGRPGSAFAAATGVGLLVVAALDLWMGTATFRGRTWARILLMLDCAVTVVVAFAATTGGGALPTLGTGLPHVALGILVLLALTSPRARGYATRAERAVPAVPAVSEDRVATR
jgi:hypothetical protein